MIFTVVPVCKTVVVLNARPTRWAGVEKWWGVSKLCPEHKHTFCNIAYRCECYFSGPSDIKHSVVLISETLVEWIVQQTLPSGRYGGEGGWVTASMSQWPNKQSHCLHAQPTYSLAALYTAYLGANTIQGGGGGGGGGCCQQHGTFIMPADMS